MPPAEPLTALAWAAAGAVVGLAVGSLVTALVLRAGAHRRRVAEGELRQRLAGDLVAPVRQALERVEARLSQVERSRAEDHGALSRHLHLLVDSQTRLSAETGRLSRALRAPDVRGRWGEMQLQRVVEMAGLAEHCDFVRQVTVGGGDGARRPDLVVRLPAGRALVVDAKTPLTHYLDAVAAEDEESRSRLLAGHARSLRRHLVELGSKAYWERLDETPEFVVLFLPGEAFLAAAVGRDPELIEFGVERRVILATPTTLVALLHAVAYGWRQEQLTDNAREIAALGRELHGRLRTFVGHFEAVRRGLEGAVTAYNRAVGSFESRVLAGARRFEELGASSGDGLDELAGVEERTRVAGDQSGVGPEGGGPV